MKKEDRAFYWLITQTTSKTFNETPQMTVLFRPVPAKVAEKGGITGYHIFPYETDSHFYHNLVIAGYYEHKGDKPDVASGFYGWHLSYNTEFGMLYLEQSHTRAMYKTLSRINRGIDRYREKMGRDESFHRYVTYVSLAMGHCKGYIGMADHVDERCLVPGTGSFDTPIYRAIKKAFCEK